MPRLVRFVIAVVGCLGVVAGVLMPLGVSARPGWSVLTAATKATGTLEVTVNRSGTYTVSGQGIQKSAHKTRTFQLTPGVYTVTAADATVTPKKVRVWNGDMSSVSVAFHGVPMLASALATGRGPCAVLQDGKVGCWKEGLWPVPRMVRGITNPLAVSGQRNYDGGFDGCAVLSDGTVKCSGNNTKGQLGNGTTVNSTTPVPVTGITTATGISYGGAHACAVLSDGTVRCWGLNLNGQLGNGTTVDSATPVAVTGITNARAVSAGPEHTCALLSDGTVVCWGGGPAGQLGNGTWVASSTPVAVPGVSDVTAISAGTYNTCALRSDHTVQCWGSRPESVAGIGDATAISVGAGHACAVLSDGTIRCWGENEQGLLGDGTTEDSSAPVAVAGITNATAVLAGPSFTCALLSDATVRCWGSGYEANVPGTFEGSSMPWRVKGVDHVKAIAMGGEHSCVLLPGGKVKCWGANYVQQLGNGTRVDSWTLAAVQGIRRSEAVAAGEDHTCVVLPGGKVKCWGCLRFGDLGCDLATDSSESSAPVRVPGIRNATAITAGSRHTCVLLSGGTIKCWGDNAFGKLGSRGKPGMSKTPVPVVGIRNATAVSASDEQTCAVLSDGTVKCWGCIGGGCYDEDQWAVLSVTPRLIHRVRNPTALTTGVDHSCALLSTRRVVCWGLSGTWGKPHNAWTAVPITGIGKVRAISAGWDKTYAVLANRKIAIWLANGTGDGSAPVVTGSLGKVNSVATGGGHTCAVLANRTVKCWGSNSHGELGRPPLRQYYPKVLITGP